MCLSPSLCSPLRGLFRARLPDHRDDDRASQAIAVMIESTSQNGSAKVIDLTSLTVEDSHDGNHCVSISSLITIMPLISLASPPYCATVPFLPLPMTPPAVARLIILLTVARLHLSVAQSTGADVSSW